MREKLEYTKEQLEKDIEMIEDLRERMGKIIYEPREGQELYFDNLLKNEQLNLYGIFHDVSILHQSLTTYKDYFKR